MIGLVGQLLWLTLRLPLALAAFVALVMLGQLLALAAWHWMATRVYERADRDVTAAEEGPSNVHYLTPAIAADHRERRLGRLLDRS